MLNFWHDYIYLRNYAIVFLIVWAESEKVCKNILPDNHDPFIETWVIVQLPTVAHLLTMHPPLKSHNLLKENIEETCSGLYIHNEKSKKTKNCSNKLFQNTVNFEKKSSCFSFITYSVTLKHYLVNFSILKSSKHSRGYHCNPILMMFRQEHI